MTPWNPVDFAGVAATTGGGVNKLFAHLNSEPINHITKVFGDTYADNPRW